MKQMAGTALGITFVVYVKKKAALFQALILACPHTTPFTYELTPPSACLSSYCAMGVCGAFLFDELTHPNVLTNVDRHLAGIAVVEVVFGVAAVLAFALNIFPARYMLETLVLRLQGRSGEPHELSQSKIRAFTANTVLVGVVYGLAISIPNIASVFAGRPD